MFIASSIGKSTIAPRKSAITDSKPMHIPPKAAAGGIYLFK